MMRFLITTTTLVFLTFAGCQPQPATMVPEAEKSKNPIYGILDLDAIAVSRDMIAIGDSTYLKAFHVLKQEAQRALDLTPPSVMDKSFIPPSGDKHDYMSMSPYWWPDSSKPDGLPYIRKDGIVNPERNQYDKIPGATMAEAVKVLSLMYYFTGDEVYAAKAAELLKVWFFNADTRMHPHLNYGQFVPGRSLGRSVGIIESRQFVMLTDYERFLLPSENWTSEDHDNLVGWMSEFLDWLLNSELGQEEGARTNNHGSWYDYQVVALSQYCQQPDRALPILDAFDQTRLQYQIEADGSQPEELLRTKSFNYSVFNLSALTSSVKLAANVNHKSENHAYRIESLSRALLFVSPVMSDTDVWKYKQISPFNGGLERMISPMTYIDSNTLELDFQTELETLIRMFPESRYILITPAIRMAQIPTRSID